LIDFKLSIGVVMKAEIDWHDFGQPQVAMHRNGHFSSFSLVKFKKK